MFLKADNAVGLTRTEMDSARRAFRGKLLRLRYSPQFILNNADELLAIAHSEYARAIARGIEIEDPVAWTIHCAWRRTQNLLQAESIRPRDVSGDQVGELVDDDGALPEEEVLDADRARKIREAVAKLDEDQRQIIALTFFDDMSVREAARHLGCSASSVQHRRETALRSLRRFLPVTTSEELLVDVAMACWLSFAVERGGLDLPAGFEAIIDRAGHEASGLWARVHDLARRFTVGGGNETATAIASGGGGRAAGICAAGIAVACLAGAGTADLVGPGIGTITGGGHTEPKLGRAHRVEPAVARPTHGEIAARHAGTSREIAPAAPEPVPTTVVAESPTPRRRSKAVGSTPRRRGSRRRSTSHQTGSPSSSEEKKVAVTQEEAAPVEEEFSGIAKAGTEETTRSPAASIASDKSSTTSSPTAVHQESHSASPAPKDSAAEQFGFEK